MTRASADLDLQVWISGWFPEYLTGEDGEILFSIGTVEFMIVPRKFATVTRWQRSASSGTSRITDSSIAAYFYWRFHGATAADWKSFHVAADHAELEHDLQAAGSMRALFEDKLSANMQWLKIRMALGPKP